MKRRRYRDDDRTFALRWLAVRGGNVNRTARELGMPVQTLHQWANRTRMNGRIKRAPWVALDHVSVFRGLSLPVSCAGEVIPLDLSRLNEKEHRLLLGLMARARTDSPVRYYGR